MFTTDPIYRHPLIPRITIKSFDDATTYYTYDPWTDSGTTTKAVACDVNLSQNHQGIFTVQIEDETDAISSNVKLGNRMIIECGKQSIQMTRLISGVVRHVGYSRGADRKRLLTLSGSSTAIRLNETIIYADRTARKLAQDGITLDITDPNMKADVLLESLLGTVGGGPVGTGLSTRSDVENFIASVKIEFGEAQDACNTVEEQSNGEVFVDVNDVIQFRHLFQPMVSGKGFTIKNKFATNDNADDTMYLRGKNWDFTKSCFKSDGYSNRIYGLLPPEEVPELANIEGGAIANNTPNEWAFKFRPPHSHWLPGDLYIVAQSFNNNATAPIEAPKTRFRICTDAGGVPTNVAGVIANIEFDKEAFGNLPATTGSVFSPITVSNQQQFFSSANTSIASFDLDTTLDYWLIFSDDYTLSNRYTSWKTDTSRAAINIKTHSTNLSTNSAGGSSWVDSLQIPPFYAMPRQRAEAFECSDPKALSAVGITIDSTLANVSNTIKTREAMYRYMVNQLYYMARPRVNFNMATVTAPNIPIFPNDPILISDSVMGFSTAGTQAVMTTCGDITYSWSIGNYQAPTILSIQPVSNPTYYV